MNAKISWMIYEDEVFVPYNTYMADGVYTTGEVISKRIQVWNNYRGTTAVDDAIDVKLVLSFKQYEDNFLLNLLTVKSADTNTILEPTIDIDRAIYDIGSLYGNVGGTYKEIELSIGPLPANLKSELKSLVFYLEY